MSRESNQEKAARKTKKLSQTQVAAKKISLSEDSRIVASHRLYYVRLTENWERIYNEANDKVVEAEAELADLVDQHENAQLVIGQCDARLKEIEQARLKIVVAPRINRLESLRQKIAELEAAMADLKGHTS